MLLKKMLVAFSEVNCRNLPPEVKNSKKGEITALRKGQILAFSWGDHKQVRLVSTVGTAVTVEVTRRNTTNHVPKVVVEYNSCMGGVDVSDQMTDQYAVELGTVKCWCKVVFHLIYMLQKQF